MDEITENIEDLIPSSQKENLDKVNLSREDYFQIFDKCVDIKNNNVRSRMVVNLIVAKAAIDILKNFGVIATDKHALQEIPSILSKWDISEVYSAGCKITVRYSFGEYKPFIPRKHDKYGLLGDVFMFVNIEKDTVMLQGFLESGKLNKTNADGDNYYVELEELQTFDDVKHLFNKEVAAENIQELASERVKIIQYFDGELEDKIEFFKLISSSKYLREEMIKIEIANKYFAKLVEKEDDIHKEIKNDVNKVALLADAFIQSKNDIMKITPKNKMDKDSNDFMIGCARANLEKLYLATPSMAEEMTESIQSKTSEGVMDSLLEKSIDAISEEKLPISAILKAFRVFGILFIIILLTIVFCLVNDVRYLKTDVVPSIKHELHVLKNSIRIDRFLK